MDSMPKKFKKLLINDHCNNIRESGSINEVDLRPPADDELLIKNNFAGVNATDMNIMMGRSNLFSKSNLPHDLGLEGLGSIVAIGKNVDENQFKIGTIGLIFAATPKTYSEYLYIKPKEFMPVPELKPEYIALLDCGLTAAIGLDKSGMIKPGHTVLITAAAGGTGHIGVQWAKLKGCNVIGLCSTPEKMNFLQNIGCDLVINYKTENVSEILSEKFPLGVDVIWETYGGSMFETLFNHLAIGGRIIIVGAISGYKTVGFPDVNIEKLPIKLLNKSASITGFRFRHYERYFGEYLQTLIEMYRSKKLTIRIDMPLLGIESTIDAIERLQSGRNIGKVIVHIQ